MDFLPTGFDKVFGKLGSSLPWLIVATLILIFLIILMFLWRAISKNKRRLGGFESAMKFQDLDAMRKKGLLTDEEYKNVRQSLAKRELERGSTEANAERTRKLMMEVAVNPEAARKFLTPEQLAAAEQQRRPGG